MFMKSMNLTRNFKGRGEGGGGRGEGGGAFFLKQHIRPLHIFNNVIKQFLHSFFFGS